MLPTLTVFRPVLQYVFWQIFSDRCTILGIHLYYSSGTSTQNTNKNKIKVWVSGVNRRSVWKKGGENIWEKYQQILRLTPQQTLCHQGLSRSRKECYRRAIFIKKWFYHFHKIKHVTSLFSSAALTDRFMTRFHCIWLKTLRPCSYFLKYSSFPPTNPQIFPLSQLHFLPVLYTTG